jgi:hypothetical protein
LGLIGGGRARIGREARNRTALVAVGNLLATEYAVSRTLIGFLPLNYYEFGGALENLVMELKVATHGCR